MVVSHVELRTIAGEILPVMVSSANPTVGEVVDRLRQPPHNYAPGVALMFSGKVLQPNRHINEFPDGHVIITGHVATPAPTPKREPSPQARPTHPKAADGRGAPAEDPALDGEPRREPSPSHRANNGGSPAPPQRGSTTMELLVHVPAISKQFTLRVPDTCTVAGALSAAATQEPALSGAKLIFQGKLLNQKPDAELMSFGIHSGAILHAALIATDPKIVMLIEVRDEFERLKRPFVAAGNPDDVPEKVKRQFYEDSMKLLYRLDNLEDLDPALRAQRKELVKEIQALQDRLQHRAC